MRPLLSRARAWLAALAASWADPVDGATVTTAGPAVPGGAGSGLAGLSVDRDGSLVVVSIREPGGCCVTRLEMPPEQAERFAASVAEAAADAYGFRFQARTAPSAN